MTINVTTKTGRRLTSFDLDPEHMARVEELAAQTGTTPARIMHKWIHMAVFAETANEAKEGAQ
jgi:predicted transcriptional regulator